jgi:sugar phosphate isomerase/epimerase
MTARFPLACNTVLFRDHSLRDALEAIAWAGFDGAELAFISGMVEHVSPSMGDAGLAEVRTMASDLGLRLYSIEVTPNAPDRVEQACALAAALGIPVVAIGSGGKSGDEASLREAIDLGRTLAAIAGTHGVRLALKPHVGAAVFDTATARRAHAEIGSPHLGLNFDPSHLHRVPEDVAEAAAAFGDLVVHSHFRDCPSRVERGPGTPTQQVPGNGEVDIPGVLRALAATAYAGTLSFECIGAAGYSLAHATALAAGTRGYLTRCLQEIS